LREKLQNRALHEREKAAQKHLHGNELQLRHYLDVLKMKLLHDTEFSSSGVGGVDTDISGMYA
jgi:hypothetical protein